MSGVEVAAVVVPVAVAASTGGLGFLKGPAAMLRNTQKNVDESKFLIAKHGHIMQGNDRKVLIDTSLVIEERVDKQKSAGNHRAKNAYKISAWTEAHDVEHRSAQLYASTRKSSAQSVLDQSEERIRREAARKASKENAKSRSSAVPCPDVIPPLPTKKSINGLDKKASQSALHVRSGASDQTPHKSIEVIPPLPTAGKDASDQTPHRSIEVISPLPTAGNEPKGKISGPTTCGSPSKPEVSAICSGEGLSLHTKDNRLIC